jgi:hypothetical protein
MKCLLKVPIIKMTELSIASVKGEGLTLLMLPTPLGGMLAHVLWQAAPMA